MSDTLEVLNGVSFQLGNAIIQAELYKKNEQMVEDLQKANFYNFKKHKKYLTNQLIFIGMSILMMVMAAKEGQWYLFAVGAVLLIFSTVLFVVGFLSVVVLLLFVVSFLSVLLFTSIPLLSLCYHYY